MPAITSWAGEDFTEVLYEMFLKRRGIQEEELSLKKRLYIKKQAEQCKLGFSENRVSVMHCILDGGGNGGNLQDNGI